MNNAPRPERIERHDLTAVSDQLAHDNTGVYDPDQTHVSQFVGAELPVEHQVAAEKGLSAARAALAATKTSVKL